MGESDRQPHAEDQERWMHLRVYGAVEGQSLGDSVGTVDVAAKATTMAEAVDVAVEELNEPAHSPTRKSLGRALGVGVVYGAIELPISQRAIAGHETNNRNRRFIPVANG
jgi:hypothetical protein